MVGVVVARRHRRGDDVEEAHADLDIADAEIIVPTRAGGAGRDQLGHDAEGVQIKRGAVGRDLLDRDIRNAASYNKADVLMPGASVRVFASVKY